MSPLLGRDALSRLLAGRDKKMGLVFAIIVFTIVVVLLAVTLARDVYLWVSGRERFRNAVLVNDVATVRNLLDASPHLVNDPEALFQAIFQNLDEILQLLLERGADVRAKLEWGGSALHVAARYGTLESVNAILTHGVDIDKDCDGTPLYWAADQGRLEVVELLLERGANPRLVAIERVGTSGFKPKFATPEEFERIKQRLANAQRDAA